VKTANMYFKKVCKMFSTWTKNKAG